MIKTEFKIDCVLCEEPREVADLSQKVLGDKDDRFKIVRCNTCGHVQLSPPGYSLDYYEEDGQVNAVIEHYGTSFNKLIDHAAIEAERRVTRFGDYGLNILSEASDRPLKILDVGGGYGFFGSALAKRSPRCEVTVMEPSHGRVETGKRLLLERFPDRELPIFTSELVDEKFVSENEGTFDVVTLWHVLEHLTNPVDFMSLLGRLVKPDGGIVCVEVPNLNDELRSLSPAFNNRWFMVEHVSYFSPSCLKIASIKRGNFKSVNVHGYQRYGIFNYINWIAKNSPEGAEPDLFEGVDRWWLEKSWRAIREAAVTSDALFMVCER